MQKRIWESVGGKPGEYDYEIFKKFGEKVDWYWKEEDYGKYWSDLTFSLNAPGGHLPVVCGGLVFWRWGVFEDEPWVLEGVLFSRVETCKL